MQHYIGTLNIRNGEYEYTSHIKFQLPDDADEPDKHLDYTASTFYGVDEDEDGNPEIPEKDGDGYYFNGGEVFVEPGSHQRITEEMFEHLDLITEL